MSQNSPQSRPSTLKIHIIPHHHQSEWINIPTIMLLPQARPFFLLSTAATLDSFRASSGKFHSHIMLFQYDSIDRIVFPSFSAHFLSCLEPWVMLDNHIMINKGEVCVVWWCDIWRWYVNVNDKINDWFILHSYIHSTTFWLFCVCSF